MWVVADVGGSDDEVMWWRGGNGWALWMMVVVVEEEKGLMFVDAQIEHQCLLTLDLGVTRGQQNLLRSVNCLLMVAWCSCKIVCSFTHVTCCGVECSILHTDTIFDNWCFPYGISVEFHGIQGGYAQIPYGLTQAR